MRRASFEDMNCSIAGSLEVVGEWWTLLILRDAFLGITRFDELHERLGIARNVLATRLDTLVDAGILERRTYEEARRRHDYVLTRKGRDLWPVLVALRQWGDQWVSGRGNEPVVMVHEACGRRTRAEMCCAHCGERLKLGEMRVEGGPGLTDPTLLPDAGR